MIELELWQKIGAYVLILISLFIYVKVSNIKVNGISILKLEYRILLAVFFPLIFGIALLLGGVLLALALVAFVLVMVYSLITKKKVRFKIKGMVPRKPLN